MKSTGVGQNRQYPSTYAPNGAPSSHHQDRMPVGSQQRHNYGRPPRTTSDGQQHHHQHQQQKDANGYNANGYNANGYDANGSVNSSGFGGNNSYRPNRGTNQSGQRGQYQTNAPSGQDGRPNNNNNSYKTASAGYQPRQIQKSADLESEYTRLHRQDEMIRTGGLEQPLTHYVEDPTNSLSTTDMATAAAAEQISAGKQDLPVLTLKNSLSKISFCDRECFNVNDNPTKEAILKYIETKYKGLNIIDNQYVLMKPHMLKNITYHEHILTTFTNGNPYLLFLTRIDNVPCSIFIDRKVKDGYCYPKIHCVQYKFAAELFDAETIFTGELVRDVNRNFQYLISDLLVHNGEYIKHRNILSRFQTLHSILEQQYTLDPATEICPIYCKRLFQYADIKFLIQDFLPVLSYTCKGLVFHTLNNQFSDYAWVMPREKQIEVPRRHELDAEFYRRFPEFTQYRSADTNQMSHLTGSDEQLTNSTNLDQQQPSTTTFAQQG